MCQIWFFYWEIFDHCLEFFLHLEKEFGTGQSGLNDKNTPKVETTVWPFCAKGQKGWRTGGQKGGALGVKRDGAGGQKDVAPPVCHPFWPSILEKMGVKIGGANPFELLYEMVQKF